MIFAGLALGCRCADSLMSGPLVCFEKALQLSADNTCTAEHNRLKAGHSMIEADDRLGLPFATISDTAA